MKSIALLLVGVVLVAGCQTVHTELEDAIPIAMFLDVQVVREGVPPPEPKRDQVARQLKDAGIPASTDTSGVFVKQADAARARMALLTDKRFADSGVIVLIAVDAGTVEKTEAGYLLKELDAGDNYFVPEGHRMR